MTTQDQEIAETSSSSGSSELAEQTNEQITSESVAGHSAATENPGLSSPSTLGIVAAFATVYIVWGSTYLAIRFAVETIPPFFMASLRFIISGLLMYGYLWFRGKTSISRKEIVAATLSGCLMLVGGNGLVCWAEQFVPSGVTALIIGTAPLWIVLLGWLSFGAERPGLATWVGLILGLIGVYLLADKAGMTGDSTNPFGAIALLAACFFWAWGSFLSKSPAMPKSTLLSVAVQMLAAGVALLLTSLALGEPFRMEVDAISTKSILSLAYLIVFGAIIAYTCYGWLFRTCSPSLVSTYAYVNPMVAVILGYFLADEEIGANTLMAAILILGGVFLVSIKKYARSKPIASS